MNWERFSRIRILPISIHNMRNQGSRRFIWPWRRFCNLLEANLDLSFAAAGRRAMRPIAVLLFVALCVSSAARTAPTQTAAGGGGAPGPSWYEPGALF